jgi:hypothetical protein
MTIRDDLLYFVQRYQKSFDFKYDEDYIYQGNKKTGFTKLDYKNNTKNNMLDRERIIYHKGNVTQVIYECQNIQTVANYPMAQVDDTIADGEFFIMCFVSQGGYRYPIHAVVRARDMKGHYINDHSMDVVEKEGRHLLHSKMYQKNPGVWEEPTFAYSKACFIRGSEDQLYLNEIMKLQNINNYHKDNDDYILIPARLETIV